MVAAKPTLLGSEVLHLISTSLDDFLGAKSAGAALELPDPGGLDHVVLTGMGGSGAGNSIAAALVRRNSPIPILVTKDYWIPKFVGPRTLVIGTTYSGETEETLYAVGLAHRQGAHVAGITSGGTLARFLEGKRAPLFRAPLGRQPRAALPVLLGAVLGMLERLGIDRFDLGRGDEKRLRERIKQVGPNAPEKKNPARELAAKAEKAHPTIYGEGTLGAIAGRLKAQFNENAKIFARAEALPEANHNDLVAWADAPLSPLELLVTLRTSEESKATRTRFEFLEEVATRRSIPRFTVRAEGDSELGRVLDALIVGDSASVYTALLRNVDPTPVPIIPSLKERLGKSGLAQEARSLLGL